MVHMTIRSLRVLVPIVAVLAIALPAAGGAARADLTVDRGVVQSVAGDQIVLRALDGGVATFAVAPTTRVKLNGIVVALADIRPGFVASVVHDGTAPATLIRAFGVPAVTTERGIVTVLTRTSITFRTAAGTLVAVPLTATTRFRFRGVPAPRYLARPGSRVAVRHIGGGPATVVNVLERTRA